jgi:hypothetical protein
MMKTLYDYTGAAMSAGVASTNFTSEGASTSQIFNILHANELTGLQRLKKLEFLSKGHIGISKMMKGTSEINESSSLFQDRDEDER